jgi:hypothetical protein
MGIGQMRAGMGPRSFWRRLVGTALIYALIMQPLVLAITGAQLANASAIDPLSQLCEHATDGTPLSPAGPHKPPADDHCAFCFVGAFHLLGAPRGAVVQYVSLEVGKVRHSAHPLSLSSFSRYSVARPRGPPFSA